MTRGSIVRLPIAPGKVMVGQRVTDGRAAFHGPPRNTSRREILGLGWQSEQRTDLALIARPYSVKRVPAGRKLGAVRGGNSN
jgi:hypothetical protein